MALTNIELYEALKKDVSEESARMIAEALTPASGLMAKVDHMQIELDRIRIELDRLVGAVAGLGESMMSLERRMNERFASFERRFIAVFAVPLWGAVAAGIVKLFTG